MATARSNRLTRPVDATQDHFWGPPSAPVTLLEYGDYQCPYCRRAQAGISRLRDEALGDRMRYVFRHFPNTRAHPQAWLAAEAAEAAGAQGRFWEMHEWLFEHQDELDRDRLVRAADGLGLDTDQFARELDDHVYDQRVREDFASARQSGARATPTFFINDHRYEGAWDHESVLEAIQKPLGLRVRLLAREFAGLSTSAGIMLLVAAMVALIWANSPWRESYNALWETPISISFGVQSLPLTLHRWVNEGLIVLFFLVVTLEIKREITAGHLSDRRQAALPIAAAIGGMLVPALVYLAFNTDEPARHGWGVPISTDTAFALGLLAVLGSRVPFSLRVFVAALAIADDVGAILVLAIFYTADLSLVSLSIAALLLGLAIGLNRARVYSPVPYALVGIALWLAVLYSGVHGTLAGVLLALTIPTRAPPDVAGLYGQSIAAFQSLETPAWGQSDRSLYLSTVRTLETIVNRMLSPAQRLERDLQPWSAYLVLPLFALANAGIPLHEGARDLFQPVGLGVILGLLLGKPLGIALCSWLAVRSGFADLPEAVSWRQLVGAGFLCGIGFTMSIFFATAAFDDPDMLAVAKLAIMLASLVAGIAGWLALRKTSGETVTTTARLE